MKNIDSYKYTKMYERKRKMSVRMYSDTLTLIFSCKIFVIKILILVKQCFQKTYGQMG